MKPKSISRFSGFRHTSTLALVSTITAFAAGSALAVDYQWRGTTDSIWSTTTNWSTAVAPTGNVSTPLTGAHRLNVNNAAANEVIYTAAFGTTTYNGTGRGLAIGSGALGNGTLRITGGKFSTVGSGANDIIGNTSPNSGTLVIDGGEYETSRQLECGLGFGTSSTFTVNSGMATVTEINTNNTTATFNLNGGTLAMNRLTYGGGGSNNFNINGGTLKARIATSAFIPTPSSGNTTILVKSLGAIIDTNTFNISIARPLLTDPVSTGGGLTKKSSGLLTLGAPSTLTGAVTVEAGGLGVKAGATSWTPSTFSHSGNTLNFDLGVYNISNPPLIDVATLTLNTTDITVNISGSSIPISSEIKILDYGTKSGTGSLKLNIASLPTNMVATLEENTVDGYYYLNVTSPSATSFTWSGDINADATGDWDTTSLNWNTNAAAYAQPALVSFPSITGGGTVTITADVAPITLDINNATLNPYTFTGTGKITGNTGITKAGTGIAKFNGAAHTYSGTLSINAGAIIKQVADATTGGITVAADNVSFVLDGGITEGSGQILTISGRGATAADYFFTGSAVQRGALQAHNGANTWEGNIVLASNSTSVINRIGVQNGASLTLTGTISESVTGAPLLFRGGVSGDNITLGGVGTYAYTGQTQIFSNGGSIILGADHKLPTTASVFFGSSGTTVFDLNGNDQEFAGITGNAFGSTAIITNNGSGPSILSTTSPAESPTETTDYFPSIIADGSNTVSFVKNGNGTQILAGNSTYTGTTTVNAGRLEIQENQSATGDISIVGGNVKLSFTRTVSSGVNLSIASGAFFYPDGSSQTLGKLEGAGTVDSTYTVAGVDTLTVGANDTTSTFAGVIQQSTARTHALRKIGTGTFTLTGLNTYTGDTTVEDGTLSVAQSNFADASTVTIGTVAASPAVLNLPNAGTDIVATLIIDGVSQPGNGLVYDSVNSGGAITGAGKIQVGVSGYSAWASANNVLLGENGDDDNDGVINLVEYALGLNPQVSSVPAGTFVGNLLTFTKGPEAKAAGDVTYSIETSTSLGIGSWSPAAATDTTDDISFALPPNQPGGKLFARLKVVKP